MELRAKIKELQENIRNLQEGKNLELKKWGYN